ncbi:fumarylacetoacetate hydrolase family protein [Chelativorans sp. AA-79]|uniref:fumarylacetoacetate hydrolase family protein n=1 Tax=Chelativorans sp. AA-79 TaxID=3028735 RepID=UPI0023F77E4C|nr:fumarylacetoacetate hydrolase family protein [Chelativorans sp. AA-79]WEX12430.1 fumarylacetoacetate hydrolase family protein [Chelativorans sp. AA-79]
MRLARSGQPGFEKPSIVLDDGTRRDISILVSEIDEATLRRPWHRSFRAIAPGTLPAVLPGARFAIPVEHARRVFQLRGDAGNIDACPRLGDPAGADDPLAVAGLGQDFSIRVGIAAILAEGARLSGLAMFTDITPLPAHGSAHQRLIGSRHGLWALGPYILTADEASEIGHARIRCSVSGAADSTVAEGEVSLAAIGAIAETIDRICPLDAGDILLAEAIVAPRLPHRLSPGDVVEVSAGRFGRQSRAIV